jgi:hypothetical protein
VSSTAKPLVKAPLPASASANGRLVKGFPTAIMGPAPESDILSSSIATQGDTMQVTLVARTDASEKEVTEHYRALWSKLGLTEAASSAGSADLAYSDQYSSLSLAFTTAGTGTVYQVFGVLRTG